MDETEGEVRLIADWTSNHYTGPSRFVFVLEGDRVKEMRITNA